MLTKFKYIIDNGITSNDMMESEKKFVGNIEVDDRAYKTTARSIMGEHVDDVKVKIENPSWNAFKSTLKLSVSAKSTLEKVAIQADDILAKLELYTGSDKAEKIAAVEGVVKAIREDLGKLRSAVVKAQSLKQTDVFDDVETMLLDLNKTAMTHKDCMLQFRNNHGFAK